MEHNIYIKCLISNLYFIFVFNRNISCINVYKGMSVSLEFLFTIMKYLGIYICHRHEIQIKEKTKRSGCLHSNWGLWC